MLNAGSRRDALHLASLHHSAVSHAVLVFERAADDVTDDFKIAVWVRAKTLASLHSVFVNHPQAAESDVLRVVIIREGKGVVTVQPAVIGMATFVGASDFHHVFDFVSRVDRLSDCAQESGFDECEDVGVNRVGLPLAPILVINLNAIFRGNRVHEFISFLVEMSAALCDACFGNIMPQFYQLLPF